MNTTKFFRVSLLMVLLFSINSIYAQTFTGVTQAGATAVQAEVAGVKLIVKYVMFMLAAGAFAYAAWAFFFRPEESTKRIAGLVGGLVCAAVGVALQFLA